MERLDSLRQAIFSRKSLVVLFSGGLDSSVLARLASEVLGESACALTFASPISPRHEIDAARRAADAMGMRHVIIETHELADPEFTANTPLRCYVCRKKRNALARAWADAGGFGVIADGANATDLDDHRPGLRASREDGIWQPFVELGLTKDDVRRAAVALGIDDPHRGPNACLCTRIPYGMPIEEGLLQRVDAAEAFVRGLGFRQVRVRCLGYEAALVQVEDPQRLMRAGKAVAGRLKELGFAFVGLDPEGYASGSMNRILLGPASTAGPDPRE